MLFADEIQCRPDEGRPKPVGVKTDHPSSRKKVKLEQLAPANHMHELAGDVEEEGQLSAQIIDDGDDSGDDSDDDSTSSVINLLLEAADIVNKEDARPPVKLKLVTAPKVNGKKRPTEINTEAAQSLLPHQQIASRLADVSALPQPALVFKQYQPKPPKQPMAKQPQPESRQQEVQPKQQETAKPIAVELTDWLIQLPQNVGHTVRTKDIMNVMASSGTVNEFCTGLKGLGLRFERAALMGEMRRLSEVR